MKRSIFTALAFSVGLNATTFAGSVPAEADSAALVAALSGESPLAAVEEVAKEYRDYAPAYHELAKLYMAEQTIAGRAKALRAIRRALVLAPDNPSYLLTLGDIRWAQGFRADAKDVYRDADEAAGGSPEASYHIGFYAMKQFLRYRDMMDAEAIGDDPSNAVIFKWIHFAEEDRDTALAYLERSIETDPDFKNPYYALGLIALEDGRPEGLVEAAERLLARHRKDKNALLFKGLGHQRTGDAERAWWHYSAALKAMAPDERTMMESVDEIVGEKDEYLLALGERHWDLTPNGTWMDSPERERFWRKQDPLYLTPWNERRMEHYGRVAYANLRFSQPELGIEGWKTEKGQAYIRYGPPLTSVAQRPEIGFKGGGMAVTAHTDTWFYEGYSLTFQNWDGLDGWRFLKLTDEIRNYVTHSLKETHRLRGPRFVDPYRESRFTLPFLATAFQESASVRLEVAYAVPRDRVVKKDTPGTTIDDGLFLFDENWAAAGRRVTRRRVEAADAWRSGDDARYELVRHSIVVKPGTYNMAGEVRSRDAQSIGSFRTERVLTVSDDLGLSDLLLARNITPKVPFPEGRDDLDILPNPIRTYRLTDPLFVYLELYNLAQDAFGQTRYQVAYRVGPPGGQSIDPTLFMPIDTKSLEAEPEFEAYIDAEPESPWAEEREVRYRVRYVMPERNKVESEEIAGSDDGPETTVTAQYRGESETDFTYLQIDLAELPFGVHALTVMVTDQATQRTVEKSALFRVDQ